MANELVKTLVNATELPESALSKELDTLFARHGTNAESVTLDELREIMADYLQTVLLEVKEELSA
ncbi:hypothetical protein D3C87_86790 [compost metagenome]